MSFIGHVSHTNRYKDQTPGYARGVVEDEFVSLYNQVVEKLKGLQAVSSISILQSELDKIKKPLKKLMTKYFTPALLELETSLDAKSTAQTLKGKFDDVYKKLDLQLIS